MQAQLALKRTSCLQNGYPFWAHLRSRRGPANPQKNRSLNVLQYLQNSCDALASATSLSLSFDGRTLGGEDTTLCAVYNFEQDISRWAPPQVRGGTNRPFKHLPGKRG